MIMMATMKMKMTTTTPIIIMMTTKITTKMTTKITTKMTTKITTKITTKMTMTALYEKGETCRGPASEQLVEVELIPASFEFG